MGGAAPVAFVRHGLARDLDLAVESAGSQLSVQLRGQHRLDGYLRLLYGIAPYAGLLFDGDTGARGGGTIPLILAIDVLSLFEVWVGARVGAEYGAGQLGDPNLPISFTTLRTGGVIGLAAGFRRFHVMVELAIDHEVVFGSVGDQSVQKNGLVLTPGFALRLRL